MDDRFYMAIALEQAEKAGKMNEVPVGAVIVDNSGRIIGRGHNQPVCLSDPTGHAEILALRMAAAATGNYRIPGATIYTTIEPCIMCMGAIIHARIAKIVYGANDPKWGAAGTLYNFATDTRLNHNIDIVSGVCRDEAKKIIINFFRNKRNKKEQ